MNQRSGMAAPTKITAARMYFQLMPAMNIMARAIQINTAAEPSSPDFITRSVGTSA